MILKSLNKLLGFLILIFLLTPFTILAEEEIDIWNKEKKQNIQKTLPTENKLHKNKNLKASDTVKITNDIKISSEILKYLHNSKY